MMKSDLTRAVIGGFIGTCVITAMMYLVAPVMTGQPADVAAMLGSLLGGNWYAGMAFHFVNGSLIFPTVYAVVLATMLPGAPVARGTLFGVVLWFLAQAIVMPAMGGGFFSADSGGMPAVVGSLIGHALYGSILGSVVGHVEHVAAHA